MRDFIFSENFNYKFSLFQCEITLIRQTVIFEITLFTRGANNSDANNSGWHCTCHYIPYSWLAYCVEIFKRVDLYCNSGHYIKK